MKAENEIWQIATQGEIYQADLPTLKQWIGEGLVRPEDMVRKGNFKWIEAGRAPALRLVFTGEEMVEAEPPAGAVPSPPEHVHEDEPSPPPVPAAEHDPGPAVWQLEAGAWVPAQPAAPGHCDAAHRPEYVCRVCGATFCRACVKFPDASRIALCALCGDFCRPFEEVRAREEHREFQSSGFGLGDFALALAYPFKNVVSLIFGATLYGVLLLGGFRGQIIAYAIIFGCISIVINKVAYGRLDKNFLPDFSSFSPWDDLFMPLLLGVGVTAVTIGPTLLLLVALLFGWFGGQEAAPSATSPDAAPSQTVLSDGPLTHEDMEALIEGGDPRQEEELKRKVQAMTPAGQLSRGIEEAEREPGVAERVFQQLTAHPGLIALLLLVALGWAVFYYPMALAVAGYTEDLWSVINPLVGLDTIRRMGMVYAKAFSMYLVVQAVGFGVSFVVAIITAPFSLPLIGNLPATLIDGMLTFYINLVVACLLGLALFKSADRLGIEAG